jgi:hypothetical protein
VLGLNHINFDRDLGYKEIQSKKCIQKCRKHCDQNFFDMSHQFRLYFQKKENNVFKIESKNLPVFEYSFEPKYSLWIYASNIGGLISLWFGLAVIDVNVIIKSLLKKLKDYLLENLLTDYLLNEFMNLRHFRIIFNLLKKLINVIKRLDKYNWKLIVNIICILCLLYQILFITTDYMKFSTNNSIKLIRIIDYKRDIETKSLPAITICNVYDISIEQLQNKAPNISMEYLNFPKYKRNFPLSITEIKSDLQTNNSQIKEVLSYILFLIQKNKQLYSFLKSNLDFDSIEEIRENLMKKNIFSENGLKLIREEMRFYAQYYKCYYGSNKDFIEMSASISPNGKCHTYSHINNQINTHIEVGESLINIEFSDELDLISEKFYIHSSGLLPSLIPSEVIENEFHGGEKYQISEYRFRKLEYPYDTNCHNYGNKTRADCINQCFLNQYMEELNCIPQSESLLTIIVGEDFLQPNVSFCLEEDRNKIKSFNESDYCYENCSNSCDEQYFYVNSFQKDIGEVKFDLDSYQNYYIEVTYTPKMVLTQYIVTIINSMSLRYGINFRYLVNKIIGLSSSLSRSIFSYLYKNQFYLY